MASDEAGAVRIYAAGKGGDHPGPGGWSALLAYGDHRKTLTGGAADTTAARMALTAAVEALESLKRPVRVHLYGDSEHLRAALDSQGPDDLVPRLRACAARHKITWRAAGDPAARTQLAELAGLATAARPTGRPPAQPEDGECRHGMTKAYCADCRQLDAGVLPTGYRTAGGSAYHNDDGCYWLRRGQQRQERMGRHTHEIVRIARASVLPGELEPCEHCCTTEWLRRNRRG
ncbi:MULTISPECIES: RNase H family protein [Amycolatopsis]|uniref:RNase H family protein n=1 Tax=Amycolatopsis TaxID=1813 RepID=UPI0007DEC1DF|nr:RNase H family protein [Amycolatopsis sp. M39]OAP25595.1 Ribonuclease H [Amycolatopsis sp. M39]